MERGGDAAETALIQAAPLDGDPRADAELVVHVVDKRGEHGKCRPVHCVGCVHGDVERGRQRRLAHRAREGKGSLPRIV